MTKDNYLRIENYMISCMGDSAHDKEHVYRVLYTALEIAKEETGVDYDILIAACLLHDIGRREQFENPSLCHALAGSKKAYSFLTENGFDSKYAQCVCDCIRTHRYRNDNPPQSLEAKILFDADKLDAAGTIGIARTLIYKGIVGEPIYSLLPDGTVSDGTGDASPSFFQEYKYKLERIYTKFYTAKGMEMAKIRRQSACEFHRALYNEVRSIYENGKDVLDSIVE